ncbi:MAG: hypothetical protein ACREM8_01240, partial [Vulcanimicrobiaceae bacterium]
ADRCRRVLGDRVIERPGGAATAGAAGFATSSDATGAGVETIANLACATLPVDSSLLLLSDFFELERVQPAICALARRVDLTALVVADPWPDGPPLRGFVRLCDAEDGSSSRFFIGRRERRRYVAAVVQRERAVIARLSACGARAGRLDPADVEGSLLAAFGSER